MKTMCGTPQYIAPEILQSTNKSNGNSTGYGMEVDLWSLGAILFIMLCGSPPFDENSTTLFQNFKKFHVQFSDPLWEKISDAAKDLIVGFLTIDPRKRISAEDALTHPWITGIGMEDLIKRRNEEKDKDKQDKQEKAKRKREEDEAKPTCQYGSKCYRKNPAHFEQFRHPKEGED